MIVKFDDNLSRKSSLRQTGANQFVRRLSIKSATTDINK